MCMKVEKVIYQEGYSVFVCQCNYGQYRNRTLKNSKGWLKVGKTHTAGHINWETERTKNEDGFYAFYQKEDAEKFKQFIGQVNGGEELDDNPFFDPEEEMLVVQPIRGEMLLTKGYQPLNYEEIWPLENQLEEYEKLDTNCFKCKRIRILK